MYHIVGVTPEAPDLETASGGKSPKKVLTVTDADFRKTIDSISQPDGKVDYVMLGCPHYTINQVRDLARLLEGKTISKGVQCWVLTSFSTKELARHLGYLEIIRKAGGNIVGGTCVDLISWELLYRGKVGITDSPKAYYYCQHRGMNFILKRRSECIEAALRGGC
jgi:predicted aconitase